ncbi:hypothetical protein Tco_0472313 [Tanacetum coccineum]
MLVRWSTSVEQVKRGLLRSDGYGLPSGLCQSSHSVLALEHSSRWTNVEKSNEVSMSSSNEVRESGVRGHSGFLNQSALETSLSAEWEASLNVLEDFFSFDLESLDDSTSLLDFLFLSLGLIQRRGLDLCLCRLDSSSTFIKKQKVDEDKETTELQSLIKVIPDEEEVAIDVVPLATKVFSQMLKSFSREDLEDLYKLVKAKYGSTRPVEDLDLILYGDLKIMFEPHVEDQVWKNQDDYNVLDWNLYDSYMLNKKLQGRIVGIKRLLNDLRVTAAQVMDIQEKNKNQSQIDKTKHENGKSVKEKSSQSQKSKKVKVKSSQSQPREVDLERASKTEPKNLNFQK